MDVPLIPASQASFKYFYTDPLAAAWMAKHFGMRFNGWQQGGIVSHSYRPGECDLSPEGCFRAPEMLLLGERFYIHFDSMHLLQPQVGDVASRRHTELGRANRIWFRINSDYQASALRQTGTSIIQRSGWAFMWPEREES